MKWVYGGFSADLDLMDADTLSRYQDCVDTLRDKVVDGSVIRGVCGALRAFFDDLFGEGAGDALLGSRDNLREALACYADFLAFANDQGRQAKEMADALLAYSPQRLAGR